MRSLLGDCCQNHDPVKAPVVYPHRVTLEEDGDSMRAEYLCTCRREWLCWWSMRAAGWTLADLSEMPPLRPQSEVVSEVLARLARAQGLEPPAWLGRETTT
jgi:hypothetical protein